ncbi:hypothetical protein FB451DRAFT_429848 [Mycena latifolia]|nr:hypothetical protein FB451DRAFT_429848 [Mycena latifolia]
MAPSGSASFPSTSWANQLPRELHYRILHYIPLRHLRDTALVCRSWTGPSQSLLFHTISLKTSNHSDKPNRHPPRLLDILLESPHLIPYIQCIDVHLDSPSLSAARVVAYPISFRAIATLLPLLKRTRTLKLASFSQLPVDMVESIGQLIRTACLENVHFHCVTLSNSGDFFKLFHSEFSLKDLQLAGLTILDDAAPVFPTTGVCTIGSLQIAICGGFEGQLATWLSSISVTELCLYVNGNFPDSTVAILRSLAHCLVDLKIVVAREPGERDLPRTSILFPNLRSLVYQIQLKTSKKFDHTGLLAHFEAPNLEEISVRFDTNERTNPAGGINFPGIDTHLNRPGMFPSLRKFELVLSVSIYFETAVVGQQKIATFLAAVEPQFPNMKTRGFWHTSTKIHDYVRRVINEIMLDGVLAN